MAEGAKWIAVFAGVALLFSWFGVYGTDRMPFLPRFGIWFMTMLVGGVTWFFVEPRVARLAGGRLPGWAQAVILALIISVPITIALTLIGSNAFHPLYIAIQYGYVLVVSIVICFASVLLGRGEAGTVLDGEAVDPAAVFLERLPVKYRTAALYAVSAEDHYLRVHTSVGEELILMRFSDALRELEGAAGLQTHRSWWVALDGVSDSEREDGKLVLALKSGGRAAVSRTYASAVKAASLC